MDKMIIKRICELKSQGAPFALVTIISTKGSTPQKVGAAMLVENSGNILGTVGGGCGEAEVRQRALLAMDEQLSCTYKVTLLNDLAAMEGMICGGIMEFFIQVL